jgi:spermidine synthase
MPAPRAAGPVLLLFFLSGCAGLVYEISWARQLGLLFGHTVHAAAVVLGAYFFGMALGNHAAGRVAERLRRPLLAYAAAELAVALWAAGLPLLMHLLEGQQAAAWLSPAHPTARTLLRAGVSFALLLPATVALGATLPCVAQHLSRSARQVALAYASNTAGAFTGVVLATFLLLLHVGVARSSWLAAGVSALCAAGALGLVLRGGEAEPSRSRGNATPAAAPRDAPDAPAPSREWLILAAASGFGTLGLQVLYTRALALTLQNSAYTFGSVVAVFLASLALGSLWVARAGRRTRPRLAAARACALGAALIPVSIAVFWWLTGLRYFATGGHFATYIAGALALGAAVVGPAVTVLGVLLPLTWLGVASPPAARGRMVGGLTASNTVAATLGSLLTSFLLLPALGLWTSFALFAIGYLALSAWLLAREGRWRVRSAWSVAALVVLPGAALLRPHYALDPGSRLRARWETPYGWIDVVEDTRSGTTLLRQNVHYVHASTAEARRQRRQAHLPLLLHARPRSVLFLGLSTGITAGAALAHPEVERVEVAELIPEVAQAARLFAAHNAGVLDDARVTLHINDARHHLRATRERFDVIVSDLFVPWESHTGYLYTVEHFRVAREKLAPGGLFCLWIAPWQVGARELEIIADSFASVFPQVSLWWISAQRRDLIALVGSEATLRLSGELLERRLDRLRSGPEPADADLPASADFADLYAGDWIVLRPDRLNSDEHPLLEFLAPVAQLERSRLGPRRLGRFYDEVLAEMPARGVAYEPVPGSVPWDPARGRRRQREWLRNEVRDRETGAVEDRELTTGH